MGPVFDHFTDSFNAVSVLFDTFAYKLFNKQIFGFIRFDRGKLFS
jgi:hypothetical protein